MEKLSRVNKYEKLRNDELEFKNILDQEEDVKVFKPKVDNSLTTSFEKTKILKRVHDFNQSKPSTDETDIDILKKVSLNVNTHSQSKRSKESFEDMFLKPSQREKDLEIKSILDELNNSSDKPKINSTVELQTEHVEIEDTLLQKDVKDNEVDNQTKPRLFKKLKEEKVKPKIEKPIKEQPIKVESTRVQTKKPDSIRIQPKKPEIKPTTTDIYKRELKEIERDVNNTNKSIKGLIIALVVIVILFFAYVMAIMTGVI